MLVQCSMTSWNEIKILILHYNATKIRVHMLQRLKKNGFHEISKTLITYFVKCRSVMKIHEPSCLQFLFPHREIDGDAIKLLIFSNLMAF